VTTALAACSAHRKHPVGTPMRAEPFTPDGARDSGVGRKLNVGSSL
jgi:hypothetical protein